MCSSNGIRTWITLTDQPSRFVLCQTHSNLLQMSVRWQIESLDPVTLKKSPPIRLARSVGEHRLSLTERS